MKPKRTILCVDDNEQALSIRQELGDRLGITGSTGNLGLVAYGRGEYERARALFEHLLSLRNDVGLFAEEYDAKEHRQLGNFPQAFSHLALVNSAHNLSPGIETRPAHDRSLIAARGG